MPSIQINGKVALVLGASSGIGEEIARALGREGCKLVLAARRVDRCQQIIDELAAEESKFQEGVGKYLRSLLPQGFLVLILPIPVKVMGLISHHVVQNPPF